VRRDAELYEFHAFRLTVAATKKHKIDFADLSFLGFFVAKIGF
jgi:hypothetical protein